MRRFGLGVLFLSGLLAACGGGGGEGGDSGGGSSGGGGGNPLARGAFTISLTAISLTGKRNTLDIPQQSVSVNVTDTSSVASVAAGYRAGVTAATWLRIHSNGTGANISFNFVAMSDGLANGTYQTTVTIASRDISGADLQARDVQVTYTLGDGVVITPTFSRAIDVIEGSAAASQTYQLRVEAPTSVQWSARSNVAWLTVSGDTHTGAQTLSVNMNVDGLPPSATAVPGQITVTNVTNTGDYDRAVFRVSIDAPSLTVGTAPLVLGGASGLESEPVQLPFSINTGTRAHPYTATVTMTNGAGGVRVSAATGIVAAAGTTLNLEAIDGTTTASGTYTGTVRLQVNLPISTLTREVPFTYNVEQNRVFAEEEGVAFSNFPARSVLTRAVRVRDTRDYNSIPWQAASNRPWLSVTPSGTTGQSITLTADPAGLAEGQHEAEVTVSTNQAHATGTQAIRVGLTVRSTDPAASLTIPVTTSGRIKANPVDPEFYSIETNSRNIVRVYDVYSGAPLRTLRDFGDTVSALTTSDDGTVVYALLGMFTSNSRVLALRASDGSLLATHAIPQTTVTGLGQRLDYVRPDGRPFLGGGFSGGFDLTAGVRAGPTFLRPATVIGPDHRRLFAVENDRIIMSELRYSSIGGLQLRQLATMGNAEQPALPAQLRSTIAVSGDGSRLYFASAVTDVPGLIYQGRLLGTSVGRIQTCWNGRVVGTADASSPPATDQHLWVFDTAGNVLAELAPTPQISGNDAALEFSGDCTRIINNGDNVLKILGVP